MKKPTKTLMEWIREILGKNGTDLKDLPSPSQKTVETLIEKAVGETEGDKEIETINPGETGEQTFPETDEEEEKDEVQAGCPYAMKRNIVASLHEIRKFAEEHNLASAMVKALLTLLAEMALNALKGKVSGTALAVLLNALNFDKARTEAYREGEIAGRNAYINEKLYPKVDDGLPHLSSGSAKTKKEDFFSIAKEA